MAAPARTTAARALTLAELLLVISILTILALLLSPALADALRLAKITHARHDLRQIELAVWQYHLDRQDCEPRRQFPPTRQYCLSDKRHLYHVLPEELWEGGYLDGPMEDVFNPGHAYRYASVGWGFVNDSPATLPLLVPDTFPRPGGAIRAYRDPLASPVRCLIWSVGPNGPIRDFVALQAFVPADPAGWHPATPGGIVCSYLAGGAWASSP